MPARMASLIIFNSCFSTVITSQCEKEYPTKYNHIEELAWIESEIALIAQVKKSKSKTTLNFKPKDILKSNKEQESKLKKNLRRFLTMLNPASWSQKAKKTSFSSL